MHGLVKRCMSASASNGNPSRKCAFTRQTNRLIISHSKTFNGVEVSSAFYSTASDIINATNSRRVHVNIEAGSIVVIIWIIGLCAARSF